MSRITVHGTDICVDGCGVLLRGPSGAGKSDLALRMLYYQFPEHNMTQIQFIGDDQIRLLADDQQGALLSVPEKLEGLLEVRGVGIVKVPYIKSAPLNLVLDLTTSPNEIDRLPVIDDNEEGYCVLAGRQFPCRKLYPFEVSSCTKVFLHVRQVLA